MIGLATLAVALSLALAAPTAASIKFYAGEVDPSGEVGFDLNKSKKGKKKVKNFTFLGVPITCAEGANTASGQITFKMKVKQKHFEGSATSDSGGQLEVEGTVRGGGSNGTLRVFGPVPLDDETVGAECDTGVLSWNASRQ